MDMMFALGHGLKELVHRSFAHLCLQVTGTTLPGSRLTLPSLYYSNRWSMPGPMLACDGWRSISHSFNLPQGS